MDKSLNFTWISFNGSLAGSGNNNKWVSINSGENKSLVVCFPESGIEVIV